MRSLIETDRGAFIANADNAALDRIVITTDRRKQAPGYKFKLWNEMAAVPAAKPYLIKGIIALGESSAWIAPPGGMKSALMASASIAISAGLDWQGRKNKGASGVVYFALERADLVERRLMAHAARLNLDGLPIAVVRNSMFGLMKPDTHKPVVDTIRLAGELMGVPVGFVVFDTFAKLVAASGGDENQAKDQGMVFANIQRIKDETNTHIAIVGHTGKDISKGARGSNAILGDVDVMVEIAGEVVRTVTVTKANDMPEGELFSFTSAIHEFGTDEDGDPITVNVVSEETAERREAKPAEPKLTPNQKTMFALLHDAGRNGLSTADWNTKAKDAGLGIARRADLTDARMALKSKGLVREYADHWTVAHE